MADEAAKITTSEFIQQPDQTQERFEGLIAWTHELFEITVTIQGSDGSEIITRDRDIFGSSNLPDVISGIYFDSGSKYRALNNGSEPPHNVSLLLDFSKPPLVDLSNTTSQPTPNNSYLSIVGFNDLWISATQQKLLEFFSARSNGRKFIHQRHIYDILLLFSGAPLCIYAMEKITPIAKILLTNTSNFVEVFFYIYLYFHSTRVSNSIWLH